MSGKSSIATKRTRNYAFVVYPESAPDNWLDLLAICCVKIYVSPLHDKDINPTGEPKKPHYHVLVCFDNVKTQEQASEIRDLVAGVGLEVLNSARGYARYLCHLDNPEKHPYSKSDVISLGGGDYLDLINSNSDIYKSIHEIEEFIENNCIYSYRAVAKALYDHYFELYRTLVTHTVHFKAYLQSAYWEDSNEKK